MTREEAIKILSGAIKKPNTEDSYLGQALSMAIKALSEQRTGHWIYDRTRDWDGECKYECSCCGMGSDVDYAYCMRCGAKMESEEQA